MQKSDQPLPAAKLRSRDHSGAHSHNRFIITLINGAILRDEYFHLYLDTKKSIFCYVVQIFYQSKRWEYLFSAWLTSHWSPSFIISNYFGLRHWTVWRAAMHCEAVGFSPISAGLFLPMWEPSSYCAAGTSPHSQYAASQTMRSDWCAFPLIDSSARVRGHANIASSIKCN